MITDASSGIGEAAARLLVSEGVRVVLVARRSERIAGLGQELGEKALALVADVGDPQQVGAVFDEVRHRFGGLDLLFNNAGAGYNSPFETSKPEEWKIMIDANLYGVLHCTQVAIPLLRGRPGAMISSVSSVGGRYGEATRSVHSATKFCGGGVSTMHCARNSGLKASGCR